ncbi:hypothetical protein DXG01_006093 [Tephrocybe rancida]|nr:hypothetical protein DXG01_006093 [Tephrocybe rancida]
MPPSPAYSWFCVLCSTANILSHAAHHRVTQVAPQTTVWLQYRRDVKPKPQPTSTRPLKPKNASKPEQPEVRNTVAASVQSEAPVVEEERAPLDNAIVGAIVVERSPQEPELEETPILPSNASFDANIMVEQEPELDKSTPTPDITSSPPQVLESDLPIVRSETFITPTRNLQSSKVPSSRIGRLFHYGGLAASLGYGAASEIIRRTGGASSGSQSSVFMTEANIKRLVSKLSQMRGAALKLGQFLSIQDTHALPAEIDQIFRRVQDSAHYMPDWQMEVNATPLVPPPLPNLFSSQKVISSSLGPDWVKSFESFERLPFAAASIGQVHGAVLAASASPTGRPEPVAVKIQFPNIVNSIDSDLSYIKVLLTAGLLLPKGLFLDRSVQVLKEELADECDYTREASFLTKFGSPELLGNDARFKVPWVWEGSTNSVLVMERMHGASVGDADISGMSQKDRDDIAAWVLELCLKELFEFRSMQTDPNWSNFLWNVELVDFGATREYSKEFMDNWLRLLQAAASENRDACAEWSLKLGYLTGEENQVMLDAHVNSMVLLATPFRASTSQPFNFGQGSTWSEITAEIRAQIPVMLTHRLTPPPRETYSLNR